MGIEVPIEDEYKLAVVDVALTALTKRGEPGSRTANHRHLLAK